MYCEALRGVLNEALALDLNEGSIVCVCILLPPIGHEQGQSLSVVILFPLASLHCQLYISPKYP